MSKKSYVLFLRNCYVDEVVTLEEEFDSRLMNESMDNIVCQNEVSKYAPNGDVQYFANPQSFTTLAEWPTFSNCRCWFCDCYFEGIPWGCPTATSRNRDGIIEIHLEGNFCTPNCTQGYIDLHYHDYTYLDKIGMLKMLFERIRNYKVVQIEPSPPKTLRACYRGSDGISDDEYARLKEKCRCVSQS